MNKLQRVSRRTWLVALTLGFLAASQPLSGGVYEEWRELAQLLPSDGEELSYFGKSIALQGDTALIGAVGARNDSGVSTGAVYVFQRFGGGWIETAKLLPSDGASFDQFGWAVALSGDTALIASWRDDDNGYNSGSAYIFERSGNQWTEVAKLIASDGAESDCFGSDVALFGNTALIGSYADNNENGVDAGSAYIFNESGDTWTESSKLLASDGVADNRFGGAVALEGSTAIIGAQHELFAGDETGAAYVFQLAADEWIEQAKLSGNNPGSSDQFGSAVALVGGTAVVGAYRDADNGFNAGATYVFLHDGVSWSLEEKILGLAPGGWFGDTVALEEDVLLVGAPFDSNGVGVQTGTAYMFERSNGDWGLRCRMTASDGASSDFFGGAIAVSGGKALIGAKNDGDNGDDSGSVYAFPAPVIFQDGFESGDTSAWSASVP